ncbi:MAG: HIT domain-containing protein [Alphaproteobacteria bacterium]|nr:HIT domain-containing protein [Alphaproteobacteria bacterium]
MVDLRREFLQKAEARLPFGMRPSPFTDRGDWLGQSELVFALTNGFPTTPGHTLVLPVDFSVYRFPELARDEIADHHRMLKFLKPAFMKHFQPDGFNVGWNMDFCGGQSIAHAHMHIMPRYNTVNSQHGINPKGGIARMPFESRPTYYDSNEGLPDVRQMRIIAENEHAAAVALPVENAMTQGHSLILPKGNYRNVFTLPTGAYTAQLDLALDVMNRQQDSASPPDGYNLGWDAGKAAGQLTSLAYLHLVPRYNGDMASPRGGIIRILPQEAWPKGTDYYNQENAGKDIPLTERISFPFHFWTDVKRTSILDLRRPPVMA